MAFLGISSDFDLDDHGILRDSFASDFHVDDDGILHDSLHLFKHAAGTAASSGEHGTDSGIGGDKQSSTSTLQYFHASFDEDLEPLGGGDESINISDFEASKDELDSFDGGDGVGGGGGGRRSWLSCGRARELETPGSFNTPGSTLEHPEGFRSGASKAPGKGDHHHHHHHHQSAAAGEEQDLFTEDYYQQLRELGVLVDGTDFSRDESQTEFEALETHLSREHVDYDDDNRDLIGEYLQTEYDRERAEEEEERGGGRSQAIPSSRANSAPTLSSEQSFPEISPEDAERMYRPHAPRKGAEGEGEDEMMYLVDDYHHHHHHHQLVPPSSSGFGEQGGSFPPPKRDDDHRPDSCSGTPCASHHHHHRWPSSSPPPAYARRSSSPSDSEGQVYSRSRSEAITPRGTARPDSASGSHMSFASSDAAVHHEAGARSQGEGMMAKAQSQESFFLQSDSGAGSRGGAAAADKVLKRMLPTPSAPSADPSQLLRVRTRSKKSVGGNVSSAPVRPTHRSLSHAEGMSTSAGDTTQDRLVGGEDTGAGGGGELSTQLKQESSKRKQATELVQQLQKEYDSLLSKYALAELTIDQMRLGAHITLHTDAPKPASVQGRGGSPAARGRKAHAMQLPTPSVQRAVAVGGQYGGKADGPSLTTSQVQTSTSSGADFSPVPGVPSSGETGHQGAAAAAVGSSSSEDHVAASMKTPRSTESLQRSIHTQAASLDDRLDQFLTLMENEQLTVEEQEKAFDNIRADHEKLRRCYLQAKEDYNVLRRSGATPDADFDQQKELEGRLFRLGMKFDEVQERVDASLQLLNSQRQPFHTSRLALDQEEEGDGEQPSSEPDGQHPRATNGDEEAEYERRAGQLHEDYRALMDRYRRLKQMAPTSELDKETDNLVRKLQEICTEMPDMFRLPPELQERWGRLQRRDQRRLPLTLGGVGEQQGWVGGGAMAGQRSGLPSPVPSSPKVRGLPVVGDHSISPFLGGREPQTSDGFLHRRVPPNINSIGGSHASLVSPLEHNSSAADDHAMCPSSVDGAAAPRDRDHDPYDPRIARPRRHQHDFRDPRLSKMPDRGSYSSLPDSGISDQDVGRGERDRRGPPGGDDDAAALSRLPGPGHLKQLTHQPGDDDLDSGFIGSVVSAHAAQSPARHRLPQTPLRLRDRNERRRRLNSTDSSSTIGSQRQSRPGPPITATATRHPRSQAARPPPAVPALVGIERSMDRSMDHSMDRSYDAELDESTLSDAQLHSRAASGRGGGGSGVKRGSPGGRVKGLEKLGSLRSQSQSLRSQSQFLRSRSQSYSGLHQGDGTLEDVSDGEMSDTATPQRTQPQGNQLQGRPRPSHPTPPSPRTQYRPPIPHQPPTPQRPPTPYQREGEGGMVVEERGRTQQRSDDDQVLMNRSQRRGSRSPGAPGPLTPHSQRPQSRGEPTTDLYHTRPRQEQGRESIMAVQSARSGSRQEGPEPGRGEERGVGSDVEIHSDVTRGSSINSGRLRALQDEIEKLKDGARQAHEKAAQRPTPLPQQPPPPPPPPASAQPAEEGPQYYDPFDDPYGFMRVPRRRANSFSGGRVREFDDWYRNMAAGERADDEDIPLGYAAADAYNRHHRNKTPDAAHHRPRQRRRGGSEMIPKTVEQGGGNGDPAGGAGVRTPGAVGAAPPLSRAQSVQICRPPTTDPQALYSYYLPSRHGSQPTLPAHTTAAGGGGDGGGANPYRQQHTPPLSASQPNLAGVGTLAGMEANPYPQQAQQPWYTIRRVQWPAATSSGVYYPTLGQQARVVGYQAASGGGAQAQSVGPQAEGVRYQAASLSPQAANVGYQAVYYRSASQEAAGYRVEACPLCGGTGAHIHQDDVEPVNGYMAQDFATNPRRYSYREYRRRNDPKGCSRPRSRSTSRTRRYTPERSSSHSRYLVREFGDSISDESDVEFGRGRRRSRSLSKSRAHSETRSSSGRSSSRTRGRRYRRNTEVYDSDEDVDLNESLGLSEDINRLARYMLGTVEGELRRNRHRKEFGSSHW